MFSVQKHRTSTILHAGPTHGDAITIELQSPEVPEESFVLDINRKYRVIDLHVLPIMQLRTRSSCQLVRLEIDPRAKRHRNPDGAWVEGPHIHVFTEGFGMLWAHPLEPTRLAQFMIDNPETPRFMFPSWNIGSAKTVWDELLPWIKVVTPPLVDFPIF